MNKKKYLLTMPLLVCCGVSLASCGAKLNRKGYSKITLGYYPQTVVTDENIINGLKTAVFNPSTGYYSYEGKNYVKFSANPYFDNGVRFSSTKTSVEVGKQYYFEVLPISWRILDETDEYYYLTTEYILFEDYFTNEDYVNLYGCNANNYEFSYIRDYLNDEFYSKYLNSDPCIINHEIDNSYLSADGNPNNQNVCNNTFDYVSLISLADQDNSKYGFKSEDDMFTTVTDFYIAHDSYNYQENTTSFYFSAAPFITRSPDPINNHDDYDDGIVYYTDLIYGINEFGKCVEYNAYEKHGIRPCIYVDKALYDSKNQ